MEPWQQEALRRRRWERAGPCCQGCGEPITTEYGYRLEGFGIDGYACYRCMEGARVWLETLSLASED